FGFQSCSPLEIPALMRGFLPCAWAASNGNLKMLQWLREKGCPWDASTCSYAAQGGHLEVLQWARDQGCPWDASICAYAANAGHLEILRLLREYGCLGICESVF